MPKRGAAANSTGDVVPIPIAAMSNLDAFDRVLDELPVRPDHALITLGRTLAMWVDEGAGASAAQQYREVLAQITENLPPEPDALDQFNT